MATDFTEVYRIFEGRLTDTEKTALSSNNKKKTFLENALPDFECYFKSTGFSDTKIDWVNDKITEDLTLKEKKALALYMLREYYRQEKVKWSKIVNMVTDSTKISSIDGTKKSLQENFNEVEEEINQLLSTLV